MAAPTQNTTLLTRITSFNVINPGKGYSFRSTQNLSCCNTGGGNIVTGTPALMTVANSAKVSTAGSGGPASTTCIMTVSSQSALSGVATQFAVTTNASGNLPMTATVTVIQNGAIIGEAASYSAGYYASTSTHPLISPCTFSVSQPQISYQYGILAERITPGSGTYAYSTALGCTNTTTGSAVSSLDSGMNSTMSCTTQNSTVTYGTDNTAAFQAAQGSASSPTLSGSPIGPQTISTL